MAGVDAASVYPTYRKPFELIFRRVRTEEWLPERGLCRSHSCLAVRVDAISESDTVEAKCCITGRPGSLFQARWRFTASSEISRLDP